MERGSVSAIGKEQFTEHLTEHFTFLHSSAGVRAYTMRSICADQSRGGLVLFNPDRVLKDLLEPLAEFFRAYSLTTGSALHDAILKVMVTPVTLVSVKALMSLQILIITHYAQLLDRWGSTQAPEAPTKACQSCSDIPC